MEQNTERAHDAIAGKICFLLISVNSTDIFNISRSRAGTYFEISGSYLRSLVERYANVAFVWIENTSRNITERALESAFVRFCLSNLH